MDINKVSSRPSTSLAICNHAPKALLYLFFRPFRQKGVQRRLFLVQVGDMAVRVELGTLLMGVEAKRRIVREYKSQNKAFKRLRKMAARSAATS